MLQANPITKKLKFNFFLWATNNSDNALNVSPLTFAC